MCTWLATSCVLCAQNCGLLVQVDNNRIIKVKGDPENPRSRGYLCRKGQNIANFQHHEERLTKPLKKTTDGFVEITWEKALSEIGEKLRSIADKYGPRSFAFMGGGGQGSHFEATFGTALMRGIGSMNFFSPGTIRIFSFRCATRLLNQRRKHGSQAKFWRISAKQQVSSPNFRNTSMMQEERTSWNIPWLFSHGCRQTGNI